MPPKKEDFQKTLEETFREHDEKGKSFVIIKAGDLHRRVGGYPGHNNRMKGCCDVMYDNMQPGDEILDKPPSGYGARLKIRYRIPRPCSNSNREAMREASSQQGDYSQRCQQEHCTPGNTLIVVSCTRKKIWNEDPSASVYKCAAKAYVGTTVTQWLTDKQPKLKGFPWVILSAKYGFIEPEHPIGNYDVTFLEPEKGPISDESLENQVLYQCRCLGDQVRKLCEFRQVCVKESKRSRNKQYLNRVKRAFARTGAKVMDFDECWQDIELRKGVAQ